MSSSKKGNQWFFGMKAHIGVDAESGLVHTAGVTSGNVHDAKLMDRLIRDDDTAVYGDKGYASDAKKPSTLAQLRLRCPLQCDMSGMPTSTKSSRSLDLMDTLGSFSWLGSA